MKMSFSSLLLLSAGLASAQFGTQRRDDRQDLRPRLEGLYTSVQRNDTVYRTLRLGRDGTAEIATEFRNAYSDRGRDRDRREEGSQLSDRDIERYGLTAQRAARGRTVRQRGRWDLQGRNVVLRLDGMGSDNRDRYDRRDEERRDDRRFDGGALILEMRGDDLVLDRDTALYGRDRIEFRRNGGDGRRDDWNVGRPGGRRDYGTVQYDRERLRIVGIDLVDGRDSNARLTIRTEGRRIELRGDLRRRNGKVTFRTDDGEYTLRMRDDVVESIRGSGTADRHRLVFTED